MSSFTWKALVEGQEMEMEYVLKLLNIDPAEYIIRKLGNHRTWCSVTFDMKSKTVASICFTIKEIKDKIYLRRLDPPKHINKPINRKSIKVGDSSFYIETYDVAKAEKYFENKPKSLFMSQGDDGILCYIHMKDLKDVIH